MNARRPRRLHNITAILNRRARGQRRPSPSASSSIESEETQSEPDFYRAAEARVKRYKKGKRANDDKLVSTLLGFLEWLPERGREILVEEIGLVETDGELWEVFRGLVAGVLRPLKEHGPRHATYASPRRFYRTWDEDEGEGDRDIDSFKDDCLARDSSRCVISKSMDFDAWTEIGQPGEVSTSFIDVARVIPASYALSTSDHLEVLLRYFPDVRPVVGLEGEDIDAPSNGVTLGTSLHYAFGNFNVAFVATETPNQYTIKTYHCPSKVRKEIPKDALIQFEKSKAAENVPFPDPVLLDFHHRLAEIYDASGMEKYIDDRLQNWNGLKGSVVVGNLAADGSSDIARFLNVAFWESAKSGRR